MMNAESVEMMIAHIRDSFLSLEGRPNVQGLRGQMQDALAAVTDVKLYAADGRLLGAIDQCDILHEPMNAACEALYDANPGTVDRHRASKWRTLTSTYADALRELGKLLDTLTREEIDERETVRPGRTGSDFEIDCDELEALLDQGIDDIDRFQVDYAMGAVTNMREGLRRYMRQEIDEVEHRQRLQVLRAARAATLAALFQTLEIEWRMAGLQAAA